MSPRRENSSINLEDFDPFELPSDLEEPRHTAIDLESVPNKESTVRRRQGSASQYLPELLGILVAVLFLVLAITVADLKNRTQSSWTDKVISATSIAQTLWPVAFAAVVGNALKTYAHWRLENGVELGFLEQLMGSLTMGGTLQSPWTFRSISISTILLILLWSLSPLGSQAFSRCVFTDFNNLINTSAFLHMQTDIRRLNLPSGKYEAINPFMLSLYNTDPSIQYTNTSDNSSTAILFNDLVSQLGGSRNAGLLSAADLWGNVRIPKLESLPEYTTNEPEKWFEVPWVDTVVNYTSLIGVPFSRLDSSTASNNIQIHIAYLDLSECSPWENIPVWRNNSALDDDSLHEKMQAWLQSYYKTMVVHHKPAHNQAPYVRAFQDVFPFYNLSNKGNINKAFFIDTITSWNTSVYLNQLEAGSPNFIFGTFSQTEMLQVLTTTRCTLSMKYYDVNLTCSQGETRPSRGSCAATAIRQSPNQETTALQSYLDSTKQEDFIGSWTTFISTFPNALYGINENYPNAINEAYSRGYGSWIDQLLKYPSLRMHADYSSSELWLQDFMLPDGIFRHRLALLLNTQFVSFSLGSYAIFGFDYLNDTSNSCSRAFLSDDAQISFSRSWACGNKTTTIQLPIKYTLSSAWTSLLFLSTTVMMAAAFIPLILKHWQTGPDILGFVVSLTRDSAYFDDIARGPNTECSRDKAIRMRRIRVKLGVAQASELAHHQGIIAFAPEERVGTILEKTKVYL